MISSNKLLLLSFPVEFFGQNNGFRKIAHRTPEPAALASHIKVSLLLCDPVAMLQDSLGAFDDLACFERSLHFDRFGNQARILERQRGLPGDSFREPDFFGREGAPVAR